ncbi:hypothetical protein [Dyadobacter sp. CY356]|uniref:hypothetical protein n=1 Tax=Dyadobacter sp. CY356 TaxID=2906442 RepID=UPI001F21BDF7|nr:hypothetical protein [Dyadobacter sp. CY356]MCF0058265.1 hypothetical protein [Dyadobacter sp. CY356]
MKKVAALLVVSLGVLIASCNKDDSGMSPTTDTSTDVSLETVSTTAARFSIESDSVTTHVCKGKLTEVAVADLSTAITTYISTTYPSSTIKFAATDQSGKIVVTILLADGTTPKGLIFNADGTFKEELKHFEHKAKLTEVGVADLPATITSYITTTYAGAEIKKAGTNADEQYFVGIVIDSKVKVLLFNADGTFNKELDKPMKGGPKKH